MDLLPIVTLPTMSAEANFTTEQAVRSFEPCSSLKPGADPDGTQIEADVEDSATNSDYASSNKYEGAVLSLYLSLPFHVY